MIPCSFLNTPLLHEQPRPRHPVLPPTRRHSRGVSAGRHGGRTVRPAPSRRGNDHRGAPRPLALWPALPGTATMAFPLGSQTTRPGHSKLSVSRLPTRARLVHVRRRHGIPDGHHSATPEKLRSSFVGGHGRPIWLRRLTGLDVLWTRRSWVVSARGPTRFSHDFYGSLPVYHRFSNAGADHSFQRAGWNHHGHGRHRRGSHRRCHGLVPASRGAGQTGK